MTYEQVAEIQAWIARLRLHMPAGDVTVRIEGENGGAAEVRFMPNGEAISTTTGLPV